MKVKLLDNSSGKLELVKKFDPYHSQKLADLVDKFELKQETIRIFGKEIMQPRLSAFYSDEGIAYKYSGKIFTGLAWNDFLRDWIDRFEKMGLSFNSALVNYYRDGQDSMGLHADNELELGLNPTIASVNYGAMRKMVFRRNNSKEKLEVLLENGDLLLMSGAIQQNWKHELPKQKKVSEPRLNITFRNIINPPN